MLSGSGEKTMKRSGNRLWDRGYEDSHALTMKMDWIFGDAAIPALSLPHKV
jgi:hypothetical protein